MSSACLSGLFALLLIFTATAPLPATAGSSAAIRPVHGPLPLTGPSPFAGTAAMLLIIGGVVAVSVARRRSNPPQVQTPPCRNSGSLAELRTAYLNGELAGQCVCDRLAPLIRERLPAGDDAAMTTAELLAACRGLVREDRVATAAMLLGLCDRVRFGGQSPDRDAIVTALDQAVAVFGDLPESGR